MSPSSSELDPLPAPTIDGAAALLLFEPLDGPFARIDWRSSLLSLLTHFLFVALVFTLAYWMGKPPPQELPAIEVSLAPEPEPPPPPPPPAREQPRRLPPAPPPPPSLPRASDASSLGERPPQASAKNDTPSAQPADRSVAPREDKPAPQAKPVEKPEETAATPEQPRPQTEPVPPAPAPDSAPPAPATPPVLATPEPHPNARPVAPAPPAEPRPQRRSSESTAPAPSPQAGTEQPGGPHAAVYDAYLDAVRNQVMTHRNLLSPYFGSSQRSEVRIRIIIDRAGRVLRHDFVVSSLYPNLDYTIERMLALSVPLPPPPADLMSGGMVPIILIITLPTRLDEWRQAYP